MRFETDERWFTQNSITSTTKSCHSLFRTHLFRRTGFSCSLQTDGWGWPSKSLGTGFVNREWLKFNGRKREEASYSISWDFLLLYYNHQPATERSLSTMKLQVDKRWSAGRNVAIISATNHVTKCSGWLAACLPYSWAHLFIRILPLNLQRIVGQAFTCLEPT